MMKFVQATLKFEGVCFIYNYILSMKVKDHYFVQKNSFGIVIQTPHESRMCHINFGVKRFKVKITVH